ncbi:polysaccharide deacetylase [Roseomonas nepalensis]|uniref:Polysaccharide deacetylase n=1 Tax=Muricoccus nepalensis TaxID=1854500 RepID=A0A502G169_9PROT|nr:polysaccharide deacetylase [Roseomonas nepalensis]TPG55677.1 polysaccharide deacetylase [Roseomonas nepalensis]
MWWWRLRGELARWDRAGRRPRLWLRDDDARAPSAALDSLLALTTRHGVPLALAVVPQGEALPALAARLARAPHAAVIQHGTDHLDRRGGPAAEFRDDTPPEAAAAALRAGAARLRAAFPAALPVYAPPWNALQPPLLPGLRAAGFRAVSGYGGMAAEWSGLERVDAHADLLRWKPRARCRGERRFVARLVRGLAERRREGEWSVPLGVLAHHLDHDAGAWRLLDGLLRATPREAWEGLPALLRG